LRRTGAIVGNSLANRFGWNVGDRISIDSGIPKADGTTQWQLEVLGIFSDSELGDLSFLTRNVIINYDYYDSARVLEQGMVSGFIVDVSDPQHAAATGALIDAEFANSLFETSTVSEKEYTATLVQQVADINLFTELIISAVFFTLLFLTSNTMMQSVRDRIPEYAVLKTVGFSDGAVLALVLTESFVLSVGAAVIGLCIAAIVYPEMTRLPGIQEALGAAKAGSDKITSAAPHLPFVVLLRGLLASAVLALISGVIPAYQAMRLQVVEALARR
jgi:putative ABC transport system permease protein